MGLPGVKLGISHIVWGYDLTQTDRMIRFLDEAAEIGYQGIVSFDRSITFWYNRPQEFKALLDARNLVLAGVILRPTLDFAGTGRLAEFMAAVGGEVMVMSGRCGTEADWKIVLPILERHGEIAAERGIRAVYHHHTDWIAETMEQTERLLADTDRAKIGAMLDCGHATKDFVGHNAEEFLDRNHAIIEYVEFKDFKPETGLSTPVGEGLCNFPAVVAGLKRHRYNGWVVVEQNPPSDDPKGNAAKSYQYIRETLGV